LLSTQASLASRVPQLEHTVQRLIDELRMRDEEDQEAALALQDSRQVCNRLLDQLQLFRAYR
jgi:hypothetical protein